MKLIRLPVAIIFFTIAIALLSGCSNSGGWLPTIPNEPAKVVDAISDSHICWGLWQFTADPVNETLDVTQLRTGNLHLNALPFLEPPPLVNLTLDSIQFNGDIVEADIGLRHPFLGLDEFTGFDIYLASPG